MALNRSNYIVSIVFAGFVLQYNFLFSAEYLWLNFWSGSGIRTAISFFVIFLCILPFSLGLSLKFKGWSVIYALLFYFAYGLILGVLNNEPSTGMIAEGIFWLEIALYFIVFNTIDEDALSKLIRMIITYSAINAILSIGYFWLIRDQIAVAALIGDQRIVRIADLLAPLLVLLHLLHSTLYPKKRQSTVWVLPLILLIMLGMFRSVWAAFILAYVSSNLLYPSTKGFVRMGVVGIYAIILALGFEYMFEYLFQVEGVILGRIVAGIGTEDSLGRISSAMDVLNQFYENPLHVIFGAGFGKWVWFVNDFGDGEVLALQPLGSLSNYYVVFLFQVGSLISILYILYLIYCLFWISKNYDAKIARLLVFIGAYFFIQWLTFPTSIHYPVAAVIGIYFSLATRATIKRQARKVNLINVNQRSRQTLASS